MVARLSSKDLLVQSLYELMREQPYEQITVRAIAANCGLSQRTFYNHFKDKHELVEWSYLHVLEEYYESHREHMTFTDWYRVSAQTVWDQRHALRKIIRYQGQNAMRLSVHDGGRKTGGEFPGGRHDPVRGRSGKHERDPFPGAGGVSVPSVHPGVSEKISLITL